MKKQKKTALKLSSLIQRGAAVLIRARYPPGAGPDNLAQQVLPPRVTVPVLDMQNPANSDSVTARWKLAAAAAQRAAAQSTPQSVQVRVVCLRAGTHAHKMRKSTKHTGDGRCA